MVEYSADLFLQIIAQLKGIEVKLASLEADIRHTIPLAEAKERYLADNPDVREAGLDALYHYEKWGKAEGRAWKGSSARITTLGC